MTALDAPRKRRVWPYLTAGAVLLAGAGAATYLLLPGSPANPTQPTLEQVWNACGRHGQLTDGGKTLILDMPGNAAEPGVRPEEVACTLDRLNTPNFVIEKMNSTRAVDGRQEDQWDTEPPGVKGFEASWTYHPDNGLDILIREL